MTGIKRGAFFRQGELRKMYGIEAVKKKEERRGVNCKIKMPIILIKGSCVETPLYTMCWGNKDGDKRRAIRKGGGAEGGGGVDTRREGLNGQSA